MKWESWRIHLFAAACCLLAAATSTHAQFVQRDGITSFRPELVASEQADFVKAVPKGLPLAPAYTAENANADIVRAFSAKPVPLAANPGSSPGFAGSGKTTPVNVGTLQSAPEVMVPFAFGTQNLPFSTARADLNPNSTHDQYPYRAAGKLFFKDGNETFMCSAALIKKGLVLTAAHCVADFGKKRKYSAWEFTPGYRDGVAPFGAWKVAQTLVLDSYFNGTDSCQAASPGVVCTNDIAILILKDQQGGYPGTSTGWLAFGWDGAGFTSNGTTHVTQLGYPGCLDNGSLMQRNDAQAVVSADFVNNSVMGSLMCGGSSGGPIIANFGLSPVLTGTTPGQESTSNQIVGVTSWGSTNAAVKRMGFSPFLKTNILAMVNAACQAVPAACAD
jgi:V8-like Glu-specific endopeptidase